MIHYLYEMYLWVVSLGSIEKLFVFQRIPVLHAAPYPKQWDYDFA